MRKEQHWPGLFDLTTLGAIRTVREFDNTFTAPHFGFADAEDYYYRCSAMRVADRIAVPALIITAEDDPFVPPSTFRDPAVLGNPAVTVALLAHGGHCAFLERATEESDGYWAEHEIVRFIDQYRRS